MAFAGVLPAFNNWVGAATETCPGASVVAMSAGSKTRRTARAGSGTVSAFVGRRERARRLDVGEQPAASLEDLDDARLGLRLGRRLGCRPAAAGRRPQRRD